MARRMAWPSLSVQMGQQRRNIPDLLSALCGLAARWVGLARPGRAPEATAE